MTNLAVVEWRPTVNAPTRTAKVRALRVLTSNLIELMNVNIDNRRPAIFDLTEM
jgi:hypothetical protein